MKITPLHILFLCLCLFAITAAGNAQVIHLTPKPLSTTSGSGEFIFGESTEVLYPTYEGDSVKTVIEKFASDFRTVTGKSLVLSTTASNAPFALILDNSLAQEEYKLTVTNSLVTIKAAKPIGFYYALQSIRQLMPPALAAVKPDDNVTKWSIPAITVADKPRFEWRGFMLDCGRHFFDKNEIKRVLDIMSTYKMNRFHWHLTEDQGWRIEIKKYPKLTEIGSKRKYSQIWSDPEGVYHDYIPYGPYFYTQEDIKEVVAYAKERFIEIIPEIEIPGHLQAAMAAYPEFSCTPTATHEVWTDYGISSDVLNVGNPKALTFVKDILNEVTSLFPYKYIHIGGDECPTAAWQNNSQCKALLDSLGSTNYRDLQTYIFKNIENYLATKENPADRRRVIAWNETLGGDLTGSNVTIMAWTGAEAASKTAASKGLDVIMTPQIPYYINRKQSAGSNEPFSQGSGSETLEVVYAYEPVPSDATAAQLPYYKGVQANFWSEHVFQNSVLEYLMLPRIAAVAESGWTPKANKSFSDFVARIRQDSTLYQLNGWDYGKHYMHDKQTILPQCSTASETHWFRLITACSDAARTGKCIELLSEGSPLISSNSTAKVNRLWSNTLAAEGADNYNHQWWCLKENPTNPGYFALVNKAFPTGSVKSTATASSNTGRWDYDTNNMYYDFVIGEKTLESAGNTYYTIRSTKHTGLYMNVAGSGQQYSINLWSNPFDGNSGVFAFIPFLQTELNSLKSTLQEMRRYLTFPTYTSTTNQVPGTYSAEAATALQQAMISMDSLYKLSTSAEITQLQNSLTTALNNYKNTLVYPKKDKSYYICSTKYNGARLYNGADNKLRYSSDPQVENAEWTIASATEVAGASAINLQIRNKNTKLAIGANLPITLSNVSYVYRATFNETYQDWELTGTNTGNTNPIFPIPTVSLENPGCVSREVIRALGTGWQFVPVDESTAIKNTSEIKPVKVYSQDKRIMIEGDNHAILVYNSLGLSVPYEKNKPFNSGTYLVKVGKQVFKVIVE